jgi:dienelactone hydrolase
MKLRELNIQIPVPSGNVPALIIEPEDSPLKATVLVYPGLTAPKEVQRKEMIWLAEEGFCAIGIDSPHHGERDDGYLEKLAPLKDSEAHPMFIRIVQDAIQEIPVLVDFCLNRNSGNIGITGISLGGFITYGAVVMESRLTAAVPILGSPDWSPKRKPNDPEMLRLMEFAPIRFPKKFPPCALFAANAGKDVSVHPSNSRRFVKTLQPYYRDCPDHLKYVEYPESEHMMRPEDWHDLWRHTLDWFHRFLG